MAMLAGFFGGLALLLAGAGALRRDVVCGEPAPHRDRHPHGARRRAARRRRAGAAPRRALVALGVAARRGGQPVGVKFVATLLYGLEPRDPATLVAAALVLATIGALAGWLPARRASRIDPARVLRDG